MYTRALQIQHYSKRSLVVLALLCVISAFSYGLFLLLAVEHTASRANAESKIHSITTELSALEQNYLSLTQSLTPARAAGFGLIIASSSETVFANAPVLSFQNAHQ